MSNTYVLEPDGAESYYFTSADGQRKILHRENDLPAKILADGSKMWYNLGYLHREGDKPAIERADGHRAWYFFGEPHREGGEPAIEYANGSKEWCIHGKRHRTGDKPAFEGTNGCRAWYVNGSRHREAGEPAVENADGSKEWWMHGKRNREAGLPTVEKADNTKEWWVSGQLLRSQDSAGVMRYYDPMATGRLHRNGDLPAIEYPNGDAEWWKNGVCIRKEISPIVKFVKTRPDAVTPTRAHPSDVGYDLTAIAVWKKLSETTIIYETGIIVTPPDGYYVEIVPRSSITKTGYVLSNSVGIIDPSYTGSLKIAMTKVDAYFENLTLPFCRAQLILRKRESFLMSEVSEVVSTERGDGGFGSTDAKRVV